MVRRVVVTGVGLVTPLGVDKNAFMRQLLAGLSGIRPITLFDTTRYNAKLGAEIRNFTPKDFIRPATLRRMDRLSQIVTAAARMALNDAGFQIGPHNRDRVGVVLGTCFGGTDVAAQFGKVLFTDSPMRVNPILVPNTVINAPTGHAAIELGVRGVNITVNHREVSAETAITHAAAEIARGRADLVLAGGGDIISEFFFNVLTRFRTLSPQNSGAEGVRPFDVQRNGTVVGEGAGIVCLESFESAEARGAVPYCEIAGWGLSSAPVGPNNWPTDARGPRLAMTRALAAARIDPGQVDFVCAAANGGRQPDRIEAEALAAVFSTAGHQPRVSSIKGSLGEGFSSGGIRAAAMALSIRNRIIAPTLGLSRPILPLNYVLKAEEVATICCGLLNGMSSGGTFAAIIMKRIPPETELCS
jgi:3-oxoacyl-[acyl-carrier-protein] synthase II